MTKMIFIPPLQLLETTSASYRHLMLPHLVSHEKYHQHFRKLSTSSQYIILDNGANEGIGIPDAELARLTYRYCVDELVLPDVMGDPERTYARAMEYLSDYKNQTPVKPKLNYVLHGHNAEHTIETYEKLKRNKILYGRIDVLSIPRMLVKPNAFDSRIKVAQHILDDTRELPKAIHFLGAAPLYLQEGTLVRDVLKGRVRSMDTSAPYVYALRGQSVTTTTVLQRNHRSYFTSTFNDPLKTLAEQNCQIMSGWVGAQTSASTV